MPETRDSGNREIEQKIAELQADLKAIESELTDIQKRRKGASFDERAALSRARVALQSRQTSLEFELANLVAAMTTVEAPPPPPAPTIPVPPAGAKKSASKP